MKKLYLGLILTFLCVQTIFAQNLTRQSYEKAREVLDKAVTAYGGLENLRSIQNFSLKAAGDTVQRNQSRRTFFTERTPYQLDIAFDVKNNRISQVTQGGYPGGFKYHNGFMIDKTEGVSLDFIRNVSIVRTNIPPATFRARNRLLPQFLVLNVVERASRLRLSEKRILRNARITFSATQTKTARKSRFILTKKQICFQSLKRSERTFFSAMSFLKRFFRRIETKITSRFRRAELPESTTN